MNLNNLEKKRKLQKINKEGSVSLTIPREMLSILEWKTGDTVTVSLINDGIKIVRS